ncbi:MAG: NAD-dependent epimerase [Ignavibacteriae bacterium HGW-Ignavibacteriae-4]|nr:MAG: NAD-dependent epimerase [Ignavibacteriae bacterium HGW-Ignavibacteriae-4]
MKTLVLGASGATGKHLVEQLLEMGQSVKAIVRTPSNLPESWNENERLTIIQGSISEISKAQMIEYISDCDAVASCLGHSLSLKGIYGKPQKLVTNAVKLICESVKQNATEKPIKVLLMNTAGNSNRDLNEPISVGQKMVIGFLRLVLPPHVDNENAADYLRTEIGQNNPTIEWVTIRPDTLLNDEVVTEYELHPSPTRSALFNPGKTSRINVGNFMAKLATDDNLWNTWKSQMPVIYNKDS